jgi:mannitol/fructose-specific phosphotransferase system IIA component (Ntr-type)
MSRDKLLPRFIGKVGKRAGVPLVSVPLTGLLIGASLLLPLEQLVKAASSVVLTANIFAALAVLIMRASKLPSYRPSFRVPFFPIIQIVTLAIFGFLLVDIGLEAVEISGGLVGFGILLYFIFGRRHWKQDYALLHVIEGLTNRKVEREHLESELISILHEREETAPDPVDQVLQEAFYHDIEGEISTEILFREVADLLKEQYPGVDLFTLFREREAAGSTALTPFFAIPHIIVEGDYPFHVVAVRCREGAAFGDNRPSVKAVFFLIGTMDQRTLHLKVLASLAQIVESTDFKQQWISLREKRYLKSLLLAATRGRFN